MIVVSNTSPLTNLAAIGQFKLLQQLYGQIHIAQGVWLELNAQGQVWPGRDEVVAANWVKRHTVQNQPLVAVLRRDLDVGEADTIALALELQADLVLLDEQEGRHIAQHLALKPIGVVGMLLEAKTKKLIEQVGPYIRLLQQNAGFYLSETFIRFILSTADEVELDSPPR